MTIRIATAGPADYPAVLELNEGAVPNVNSISESTLKNLDEQSRFFCLARDSANLAGFLLALPESASYDSPNFRYFKDRYPRFTYVDRIVVSEDHRRRGVGRKLYSALFEEVRHSTPMVTCEVNLIPPNPDSLQFHENLGFREVGQQESERGSKRVSLLICPLQSG
ncbi:MAG: GNAT family N-acetyltransferase [Gammaproteobacteria bacterium]|nr:GNAT family N-acetyltransferase [Gammaproteobacteria bacterium]